MYLATLTIFLHGIGSSSDTWTKFIEVIKSDDDTSTIEEYIPNSTDLNNGTAYYYLYDYKTEILSSGKFVSKIKESISGTKVSGNIAIDNHVKSLKSFIEFNSKNFSIINIVAHSLGGILTMKLLLNLKDKTEIINKLETILLYGAPLKGSDEPSELKKYLGKNIPTNVLQELSSDSVTITSLNQKIVKENDYLKGNFKIIYLKGDSDNRIIEVEDAYIEKIGRVENIQGGHSEIINPKNISDQSFIFFKRFVFEHTKEKSAQEQRQKKILNKVNNISFTLGFSEFLNNVDVLANAHPNKEKVTLDDIYVYPRLENYYDVNISKKSINSKRLINKLSPLKLLIAGEGQSGKTSLCKQYIQELRKKGFIPIYLSDEKNPYEGRIENRLTSAFKKQYDGCLFDEIPQNRIIPILDNFHIAKKKDRHISDLTKYPNTILIVDDLFSLNLSQDSLLSKFKHYKIKEFSPSLRNEIIKKWMELSDNGVALNDKYEILDTKSELVETTLGKVIGNGIMPAYPFFILTIISTFETFDKPLDQEITSQGYCYQSLIYLYLRKQNVKNEDVDTYINFLTEFAFFFYKEKKKEISKDEFNVLRL